MSQFNMTYFDALSILKDNNLEVSDIKNIFKYCFLFDYNTIGINGKDVIDEKLFNLILNKIKKGYPIPYITSNVDIRGIHLFINKNVLIPRSETVDFIYNYIVNNFNLNNSTILDLCTGSGLISLLVKKEFPYSIVEGSDISLKALSVAKENARINNLDIKFTYSNYFKRIKRKYDYIISNPPYVPLSSLTKELKYEPKLALFAKNNGLSEYQKIFKEIDLYLNKSGHLFIELEENNYKEIENLFLKYNPKYKVDIYFDLKKKPRYLIGVKNE